jgi:outer membrane protein
MKRTLALIAMLASGIVLSASAQTPAAAPAGPAKIAVVAFRLAVLKTNEGQRQFADLDKKFEPRQEALKKLNDEVENLTKQLQGQADKLAPAEQESRAAAIEAKKKTLQRDLEDAQNDYQQEANQILGALYSKVYDVLQAYVEQQGFTIVLDSTASQQQYILYATPSTDITKAIVDAYNVKSGVPAPPAAAPAAPKPAARPAAKPAAAH